MSVDVLCLRPRADFTRAGVPPPETLHVEYRSPTDADVPDLVRRVRALVIPAVGPKLPPELFTGTSLALVQVTGAGVDRLDRPALTAAGIPVCNVPGGSNVAVAEYVVTMAVTLLRRFAFLHAAIARGEYADARARVVAENAGGLAGTTVGLVGLGTIGKAVAEAFLAADCRVVCFDPALGEGKDPGVTAEPLALDDLLRTSDVVSLHVPLQDSTRHLIDARALSLMHPGAVLVNAARGGIVDEHALASALRERRIAGAAVDVYGEEPPGPDNPLLTLALDPRVNLILTPHIAGVTRQASATLFRHAWSNVARVLLEGASPQHRVY